MRHLVFLLLTVAADFAADDGLKSIIASPSKTLELYRKFKGEQHLSFAGEEDSKRYKLFKLNARFVADLNDNVEGGTAHFALNFFSTMTEAETQKYVGVRSNGTESPVSAPTIKKANKKFVPKEKMWTNYGMVTPVKKQSEKGECLASDWAFSAVGSLEGRYAANSGVLRNFAEQEYLDCVYTESWNDGCDGGDPAHGYDYSSGKAGRLASTADYSYTAAKGSCKGDSVANAMVSYKITGTVAVPYGESNNIAALAEGPIAMVLFVTKTFQQYSSGVLRDTSCRNELGTGYHYVTGVGYTPTYILLKNSWGVDWGENGFIKLIRGYYNCGLYRKSVYPLLEYTGELDYSSSDEATTYNPFDSDYPCKDTMSAENCKYYDNKYGYCKEQWFVENHCEKYCGGCTEVKLVCEDNVGEPECQRNADKCRRIDFYEETCPNTCGNCEELKCQNYWSDEECKRFDEKVGNICSMMKYPGAVDCFKYCGGCTDDEDDEQ